MRSAATTSTSCRCPDWPQAEEEKRMMPGPQRWGPGIIRFSSSAWGQSGQRQLVEVVAADRIAAAAGGAGHVRVIGNLAIEAERRLATAADAADGPRRITNNEKKIRH